MLQNILDATHGVDARIVVTTGPLIDPDSLRRPAHVEVHRFVPHVRLMPHASLLVGHGGHGTTMQALAHDLPVLVLPLDGKSDQPSIGRAVSRAGAGRIASRRAGPDALAPLITELLGDGPHRAAAARLGSLIRAMPGAANGADRIEQALTDGASRRGPHAARP